MKEGGHIVFIGNRPFKSPMHENMPANDAEVKGMIDELVSRSEGKVVDYPAPQEDIIAWYGKMQQDLNIEPYVRFDKPHHFLNQVPYKLGDNNMFFISNCSLSDEIAVNAEFMVDGNKTPWLWNTETGERSVLPSQGNKVKLLLPRATSMMIVFEDNANGNLYQKHCVR